MFNSNQRSKLKINITTKEPSRKQIIISMSLNNMDRVIAQSNVHILNINCLLKDIKSEICADFICFNNGEIIITINKVVSVSDMNTIEKYMKNLNNVDSNEVIALSSSNLNYI